MKVLVLGAPGTGRSELAAALCQALRQQGHLGVEVVEATTPAAADLTLLTGLDLPGPPAREQADAQLRQALADAGAAYRVIYGQGEERVRNALAPVQALLGERPPAEEGSVRWQWSCEKCSDPECEHRLFTRKLSLRA